MSTTCYKLDVMENCRACRLPPLYFYAEHEKPYSLPCTYRRALYAFLSLSLTEQHVCVEFGRSAGGRKNQKFGQFWGCGMSNGIHSHCYDDPHLRFLFSSTFSPGHSLISLVSVCSLLFTRNLLECAIDVCNKIQS